MIVHIGLHENSTWLIKELDGNYDNLIQCEDGQFHSILEVNHVQLMDMREVLVKHNVDIVKSLTTCNHQMAGAHLAFYTIYNELNIRNYDK